MEFIGSCKECESYLAHNVYISKGYRVNHYTYTKAIKSLFTKHNETINCWTHIISSIVVFIFMFTLLISKEQDIWPIIVLLFSGFSCFTFSAIFHTFCCMSNKINDLFRGLDYAGISVLIFGSCIPPVVYGFSDSLVYSSVYLSIQLLICSLVFCISLDPKLHTKEMTEARSSIYATLGIVCSIPLIHLIFRKQSAGIKYYAIMGTIYLCGLTIYSKRIPEKYFPGKFDFIGHSHNIWHLCVIMGFICSCFGSFEFYKEYLSSLK